MSTHIKSYDNTVTKTVLLALPQCECYNDSVASCHKDTLQDTLGHYLYAASVILTQ